MGQPARFQETLRKLTIIDEALVQDQAGLGINLAPLAAPMARIIVPTAFTALELSDPPVHETGPRLRRSCRLVLLLRVTRSRVSGPTSAGERRRG
jgi:hypothetical protein